MGRLDTAAVNCCVGNACCHVYPAPSCRCTERFVGCDEYTCNLGPFNLIAETQRGFVKSTLLHVHICVPHRRGLFPGIFVNHNKAAKLVDEVTAGIAVVDLPKFCRQAIQKRIVQTICICGEQMIVAHFYSVVKAILDTLQKQFVIFIVLIGHLIECNNVFHLSASYYLSFAFLSVRFLSLN